MSISSVLGFGPRKPLLDARGRPYEPAIGPRLRILLFLVFLGTALLGVTGIYLLSIRVLEWWKAPQTFTSSFTLWMFDIHILIGVVLLLPFLVFGLTHYFSARHRKNQRAVKLGLALFGSGLVVVLSGVALVQLSGLPQLPTGSISRWTVWGLHVAAPVAAVMLYVLHRRAGPDIQWKYGYAWGGAVAIFVGIMIFMHSQDPRKWYAKGSREGEKYFEPAATRTQDAKFIPVRALMMDEYCLKCHADIYKDHLHSAHKFSSFSNPAYLFSVSKTRDAMQKRDGNVKGSRWCAGCHDPIPFLTGSFEDPRLDPAFNPNRDKERLDLFQEVDDVLHNKRDPRTSPLSNAGITCTVCHAMTNVNSTKGNGDYTLEEPQHYPFAYSDNSILQWINNQTVKAKPDFHKKTFLKPFHKTAEFCSTCHKVSLPVELNHYKEFLRGQDHYNPHLLSGVGGSNARAFYYPPTAKNTCADCHMPLKPSLDFGSKDFDGSGQRKRHSHSFPGGNTGLPYLLSIDPKHPEDAEAFRKAADEQAEFLKDRQVRIDLFGLRANGEIDGKLSAPLRPQLPLLEPGKTYLIEVVVRTLGLGHPLTQGTVDSNEIWVDFTARSGKRIIGRNGALKNPDDSGPLDEWAHRINVLMLDRNGNRIDRRNPEDIYTPLYNHQIPPGAGHVIHYKLEVPADVKEPVEMTARVRYRKFDYDYLKYIYGDKVPKLPVVDLCSDRVVLPVKGVAEQVAEQKSSIEPAWQRWNDYGIGYLLTALGDDRRPGLRQAEEAFQAMLKLDAPAAQGQGHLNLARVHVAGGGQTRLRLAAQELKAALAVNEAHKDRPPVPWWTIAWFNGLVNVENNHLDEAIASFESIVDPKNQPRQRKFDFTRDIIVLDKLAQTLFQRALDEEANSPARDVLLRKAVERYQQTLRIDAEDTEAHNGLNKAYRRLSEGAPKVEERPEGTPAPAIDYDSLKALVRALQDTGQARPKRLEDAGRLQRAVQALAAEPRVGPKRELRPKRSRFEMLIGELQPLFGKETDPEVRASVAALLSELHQEMKTIFKADELAKSTVRAYRAKHEAASHAAESIIIYPTNRKGAPGL